MPQPWRLRTLISALALTVVLSACGGGSGLSGGKAPVIAQGAPVAANPPAPQRPASFHVAINTMSDGGDGRTVSILVLVSPARAALVTGHKIALTALTDDRFGVSWSVTPSARAIAPSRSFNNVAVIFTAPQKPGIYIATATSMTNPSQSSSATITVTD
jgi:hypothetical protein